MELKTIIAIGLVLFVIGGLIFGKSEAARNNQPGRPCRAALLHTKKETKRSLIADERTI